VAGGYLAADAEVAEGDAAEAGSALAARSASDDKYIVEPAEDA